MAKLSPLRSALIVLIGAAVYFAFLWLFYAVAPYTPIPHWWRNVTPNGRVALTTWFSLLNLGVAILAAIPVAFGVLLGTKVRRIASGLAIGVVPALYIFVGALFEFGVPPSAEGWVVEIVQLFAVSLAVVAIVALVQGFPLTNGSSDRGATSSLDQGVDR